MGQKGCIQMLASTLLLWMTILSTEAAVDCSERAIGERLSKCNQFPLTNIEKFAAISDSLCSSLDCSLLCYEDAMRGCPSRGLFELLESKVMRVEVRYACANARGIIDAWGNCSHQLITWTCFNTFFKSLADALKLTRQTPPDYITFKTKLCSDLTDYKTCTAETPFTAQGSCTASQASLLTNLYDIAFSLDTCNIPKNNINFNKYGEPLQCHTNAGIIIKAHLLLLLMTVLNTKLFVL